MSEETTTSRLRDVTAIAGDLAGETDAIVSLRLLKELHDWITATQTTAVGRAMTEGHAHREIGDALGVSQQAISKRYGCGKSDEKKEAPEARQKAASAVKALKHFTPDGDYVGYSLMMKVDDLGFATERAARPDFGQPSPEAAQGESWGSGARAAVAEIEAPAPDPQLWL